jgi:hypothetical protein
LEGGLNTFLYAEASPVMYADPEGLNPLAGCVAVPACSAAATQIGREVVKRATAEAIRRGIITLATGNPDDKAKAASPAKIQGKVCTPSSPQGEGPEDPDDEGNKKQWPGDDPTKAPEGTEWRGKPGSTQGDKDGNFYNPTTKESYRPDLDHSEPIGKHWDYRAADGKWYRIYPDGRVVPK